jgi:hypothetical protein
MKHCGLVVVLALASALLPAAPALASGPGVAEEPIAASGHWRPYLPLLDVPGNSRFSVLDPSMQQSLELTRSVATGVNWGVDTLLSRWVPNEGLWPVLRYSTLLAAQTVVMMRPLGGGWLHEEWHRAVLTRGGASSRNGMYTAALDAEVVAVDNLSDQALAAFKQSQPESFARMSSAGLEADVELARAIRRDNFFWGSSGLRDLGTMWAGLANVTGYLHTSATGESDKKTAEMEKLEGANVTPRDFTGFDPTGWMYDLENPDQPYAARGAHPSGVGIRRYRLSTDLTDEGRMFLNTARNLSLLNFVSPQLFGIDAFTTRWGDRDVAWNVAMHHELTSFGQVVGGEVLVRQPVGGLRLGYMHYFNGTAAFPGLELEAFRQPLTVLDRTVFLSGQGSAWLQPNRYKDAAGNVGGALSLGLDVPVAPRTALVGQVFAKSAGWMAGHTALGPEAQTRVGLRWWL